MQLETITEINNRNMLYRKEFELENSFSPSVLAKDGS